ncbi:hypothetical protein H7Y21_01035, partial [Arenimonas sp.]|nr:hypothetical protein [Candidatus Parcubacteria bacterium]
KIKERFDTIDLKLDILIGMVTDIYDEAFEESDNDEDTEAPQGHGPSKK